MAEKEFIAALSGLIIGHLYIYLKEILPISHHLEILKTPRFITPLSDWILKISNEVNLRRGIQN
jgi:hypothetical protein